MKYRRRAAAIMGRTEDKGRHCSQLADVTIARVSTIAFFLVSQLKNQVEFLHNKGLRVVLVSSKGPELDGIAFGGGLIYEPVEIPRNLSPVQDIKALLALIKLIRRYRFDVMHSTTPKAGLLTGIAAFICRVPVRLHTYTGQRWVTLRGPMRWVARWSDKLIGLLSTKCYADSASQRQFLIDQRVVSADKLAVLGSGSLAGVDLERFDPARWRAKREQVRQKLAIAPGAKVIVFVGRVTRDKGMFELKTAFGSLRDSGCDVELILVGPADAERKEPLDQYITGAHIHAVGYSDCPERYFAISDILCLPSYREGFGTVVIEAAAMGIPAVGTDITGLRDAVVDGETGILVPPRDPGALFIALKSLLEDPERRARMGNAARDRCVKEFDARVVNQQVLDEYAQLLDRHQ